MGGLRARLARAMGEGGAGLPGTDTHEVTTAGRGQAACQGHSIVAQTGPASARVARRPLSPSGARAHPRPRTSHRQQGRRPAEARKEGRPGPGQRQTGPAAQGKQRSQGPRRRHGGRAPWPKGCPRPGEGLKGKARQGWLPTDRAGAKSPPAWGSGGDHGPRLRRPPFPRPPPCVAKARPSPPLPSAPRPPVAHLPSHTRRPAKPSTLRNLEPPPPPPGQPTPRSPPPHCSHCHQST